MGLTPRLTWIAILVVAIVAVVVILYSVTPSTGIDTKVPLKDQLKKVPDETVVEVGEEGKQLQDPQLVSLLEAPNPADESNKIDASENSESENKAKKVMNLTPQNDPNIDEDLQDDAVNTTSPDVEDPEGTTTAFPTTSTTDSTFTGMPEDGSTEENGLVEEGNKPLNRTVVEFKLDFQEEGADLTELFAKRREIVTKKCNVEEGFLWDHYLPKEREEKLRERDGRALTFTSPENKDENLKISMCCTPKAASTFWVDVFTRIAKDDEVVLNRRKMKLISINDWKEMDEYENGVTMVTVRNPWARIVSLYQQKIEHEWKRKKSPYHRYMMSVCHTKKRQHLKTFRDLTDCIVNSANQNRVNRHWQNVYSRCVLCSLDMEYLILRTENLMTEGEYYLTQGGYKNSSELLKSVRKETIRPVEKIKRRPYNEYYTDIPDKTIKELQKIFKEDIEMFGYPDTPFSIQYKPPQETSKESSNEEGKQDVTKTEEEMKSMYEKMKELFGKY